MAIKYVSQNKEGLWKVSTTKTGKAIKTFNTQKEAIAYAGTIKSTESILIKRASGWTPASAWDQAVVNKAKEAEKNSKAQGKTTAHAKATAVKNATGAKQEEVKATPKKATKAKAEIKAEPKAIEVRHFETREVKLDDAKVKRTQQLKASAKKHKKSIIGWTIFWLLLICLAAAAILIYWFKFK